MKNLISTVLLCITVLFANVSFGETITLKATLTLTGGSSVYGIDAQRGMELARQEINSQGGISGKELKIIYNDFGNFNLKQVASAFSDSTGANKISACITQWTEDSEVAWPICSKLNLPTISIGAGAKNLTKDKKFLYRIWPSDEILIRELTQIAADKKVKRAAIITAQTGYFESLKDMTEEYLRKQGITDTLIEETEPNSVDYRSILSRIKQHHCDTIFYHIPSSNLSAALKQTKELGIVSNLFGPLGSGDEIIRTQTTQFAEGLIFPAYSDPSKQFKDKFIKRYGSEPVLLAGTAYDTIKIVAQLFGKTDGNLVMQAFDLGFHNLKNFAGVSGNIAINKAGERIEDEIVIKQVSNGKIISLRLSY